MTRDPLRVFIGYDPREAVAWDVCAHSMREHSSAPLAITKLDLEWLRRIGLYRRTFYTENGQRFDCTDGRPFSTDFSFSRFLAPMLAGSGKCLFVDSDFLFRSDVAALFSLANPRYAASVVKHAYDPPAATKMRGQVQAAYDRKAWSSLVLWNCDHALTQSLTPYEVNFRPGRWLHGFRWLPDTDLGALPAEWNWLDGHSDPTMEPHAVHFTRGTPDMPGWEWTQYSGEWTDAYRSIGRSPTPS